MFAAYMLLETYVDPEGNNIQCMSPSNNYVAFHQVTSKIVDMDTAQLCWLMAEQKMSTKLHPMVQHMPHELCFKCRMRGHLSPSFPQEADAVMALVIQDPYEDFKMSFYSTDTEKTQKRLVVDQKRINSSRLIN